MKKILFLFVVAFLTAGAFTFFSCKDNDTESDDIHVEVESAPSAADLAGIFKGEDGEEGKTQLFYDGTNLSSAYKLVQETDESVIKAVKAAAEK